MSCPCVEEANCPKFLPETIPSPELSDVRTCDEQCRQKAQAPSPCWKIPTQSCKDAGIKFIFEHLQFKVTKGKNLSSIYWPGREKTNKQKEKKNSGTHMLLVYSTVHLLQQVLCYASNLFLISLTIKTFSNALSIILLLSVSWTSAVPLIQNTISEVWRWNKLFYKLVL